MLGAVEIDFKEKEIIYFSINRKVSKDLRLGYFGSEDTFPNEILYYIQTGNYIFWNENYYNSDTKISVNKRFYAKFK
jgi:hypothetical protein